jgi:alcohol dehydrogenase, propanol-preferring
MSSPLQCTSVPIPKPGSKEFRVKVRYCAIYRTDLHVIEGDLQPKKIPLIPGHQIVGKVEKLGAGCDRLHLGERIGAA